MRNFQEKRKWRDILSSWFVIMPLFLLLLLGGVSSFRALIKGWETKIERERVEIQIQELETERNKLTEELEEFRSGRAIEREAREKLNLRLPGEEVVIIVDTEEQLLPVNRETQGVVHRIREFLEKLW